MYLGGLDAHVNNGDGERASRSEYWELQLKGAGPTKYSRQGDGRKVLRSSLREFLCSEAMHALSVPTTRAGTLVTSDTRVERDIMYNGNVIHERASVVLRLAPTFLRFGSFEIFTPKDDLTGRAGPSAELEGRAEMLATMVDYTIQNFFPSIWEKHHKNDKDKGTVALSSQVAMIEDFFTQVVRLTAELVAHWQSVGFCHGVLNTDNMSVLGLTIDYGPFGFLDFYDPGFVCNGSDEEGRYRFESQPEICKWNCQQFAKALARLGEPAVNAEALQQVVESTFDDQYEKHFLKLMRTKLGLQTDENDLHEGSEDKHLVSLLLETMKDTAADYTKTFRILADFSVGEEGLDSGRAVDIDMAMAERLAQNSASPEEMVRLLNRQGRRMIDPEQLKMLAGIALNQPGMLRALNVDPQWLERMIRRSLLAEKFGKMTKETKRQQDVESWGKWLAIYRERLAKENHHKKNMNGVEGSKRKERMNSSNPWLILRNWVAQDAIERAEREGDYLHVQRLADLLLDPFHVPKDDEDEEEDGNQFVRYAEPPAACDEDICVTCSS
jgi:uncharacterized protein YdiU (UPF0061 family)